MADLQQSWWRPTRRKLLRAAAAVVLLFVAVLISLLYEKNLWDWITLLIVPAVIAGGGLWLRLRSCSVLG